MRLDYNYEPIMCEQCGEVQAEHFCEMAPLCNECQDKADREAAAKSKEASCLRK